MGRRRSGGSRGWRVSEPKDPPATHDPTTQDLAVAYNAQVVVSAEMRVVEAQARLRAARVLWGRSMGVEDPGDGYEALWAARKGVGGAL